MNKYHDMIRGGLYVIMLQIIGGAIVFFVIYHNYQAITKSASIKEHYSQTFSFEKKTNKTHGVATEDSPATNSGKNAQIYSGILGEVEYRQRSIGTSYDKNIINYQRIRINTELHDSIVYTLSALRQGSLQDSIARYLISIGSKIRAFEQTINDLNFLSKYTSSPIITAPKKDMKERLDTILEQKENGVSLIQYLQSLEEETKAIVAKKNTYIRTNRLFSSEQFAYIYNQIHVDVNQKYTNHIKLASEIFTINPNLIKSCIMVEQLRAFYTFKGLFKSIAKTNTYLTVMSKQSFGIGGMKLATAQQLEQRLLIKKPDMYKKYFVYPEGKATEQELLNRLTDTKNYYYQILYTAGLLYQYKAERSDAGYDISYNPGLLATMYNIGYSKPHGAADIGGASLKIEGDTYSFGGLAMFIYYYLEIFG